MLLNQAVEKDGEGGEADVVQRQVGSVVQRLQGNKNTKIKDQEPAANRGGQRRVWTHLLGEATEELIEELREDEADVLERKEEGHVERVSNDT